MSIGTPTFKEGDKVTIKGVSATVKTQVMEYQGNEAVWGQVYALDENGGLIIANPTDCIAE